MAQISPFRGVRYNTSIVKDISKVICPPYDIISQGLEQELYERSEYSFIRIEQGWQSPKDKDEDNKYTRAAASFKKWLDKKILVSEQRQAVYIHDHYFKYQGKEYKRRGLIARVRLEEWDRMIVRPHEGTLAGPKRDRINLLWALNANTSPIFTLYEDKEKKVASALADRADRGEVKPVIDFSDDGERHTVYAITQPELIERVCRSFNGKPLYIADGHHRYESAQVYRRERIACTRGVQKDDPMNFMMMTLVDFDDPGLLVLPPHRLLRGVSKSNMSGLEDKLGAFFDIKKISLNSNDVWQKIDSFMDRKNEIGLVLYGLDEDKLLLLRLRDIEKAGKLMPYFHSDTYKKLDVSVIDHVILEEMLGIGSGQEKGIDYDYNRKDSISKVTNQEYQLAFILKPVAAKTIKAIADASDKMPHKSTYFHPKLPSGLVLYWIDKP